MPDDVNLNLFHSSLNECLQNNCFLKKCKSNHGVECKSLLSSLAGKETITSISQYQGVKIQAEKVKLTLFCHEKYKKTRRKNCGKKCVFSSYSTCCHLTNLGFFFSYWLLHLLIQLLWLIFPCHSFTKPNLKTRLQAHKAKEVESE